MKTAIKYTVISIFILILLAPFIFLDTKPLVIKPNQLNPESLRLAKNLIKSTHKNLLNTAQTHSFKISIPQLEALLSLASHSVQPIAARANYLDDLLVIYTSIKLPLPIPTRYLNLQIKTSGDLLNSPNSYSKIGPLELPNKLVLSLLKLPLHLMFSKTQREAINNSIYNVTFKDKHLLVQADPFIDIKYLSSIFKYKAKQALELTTLSKPNTLNPKVIFYYQYLTKISTYIASINNTHLSLHSISAPLFKEAAKKSLISQDAQTENEAAIIALALFTGDYNLYAVIKNTLGLTLQKTTHNIRFTLNNRRDLALHFIYSAMIKVLANSNISNAIGEIKEISDSAKGGSGFSFPDLLADRAGVQFANKAMDSTETATQLQKNVAASRFETDFFPSISGLEEGLNAQQFQRKYGDKESTRYQTTVAEIDRRIQSLNIYK